MRLGTAGLEPSASGDGAVGAGAGAGAGLAASGAARPPLGLFPSDLVG